MDIERIERMFAKNGDRMRARLFTADELTYLATKASPAQHMAVRLAAKEAAYKALTGNDLARAISWRDIEVFTRADGFRLFVAVLNGPGVPKEFPEPFPKQPTLPGFEALAAELEAKAMMEWRPMPFG